MLECPFDGGFPFNVVQAFKGEDGLTRIDFLIEFQWGFEKLLFDVVGKRISGGWWW